MSIYHFANPADGFAYNRIELAAIDDIPVDVLEAFFQEKSPLALRWEFFSAAASYPQNPDREEDRATRDLITRALLAEYEDPEPPEPPPFNNDEEADAA